MTNVPSKARSNVSSGPVEGYQTRKRAPIRTLSNAAKNTGVIEAFRTGDNVENSTLRREGGVKDLRYVTGKGFTTGSGATI
jgi:hypothetical protein